MEISTRFVITMIHKDTPNQNCTQYTSGAYGM